LAPTSRTAVGDSARRLDVIEPYDWRRPNKFGREHVRALSVAHDVFARRMSTMMGSVLRALVQVEPVSIDQMTYDDYVRSLPNPNISALLPLSPLPGGALLEMNVGLALQMVDRMLGGKGLPVELRRPTDLELPLVRDLVMVGVRALDEALRPVLAVTPELGVLETNPAMVSVTAPSDMVLLLSFRMSIAQGELTEGLLTLCYPSATLAPALEQLAMAGGAAGELPPGTDQVSDVSDRIAAYLEDLTVQLSVRLTDSSVRAGDLLSLVVGDVLRLDHRVGRPAVAKVGDTDVLVGHLGRRGRRLALQVLAPIPPMADPFAADDRALVEADDQQR
jgi:flagellar motor switch protein FliM